MGFGRERYDEAMLGNYSAVGNAQVEILYTATDSEYADVASAALGKRLSDLLAVFGIHEGFPSVRVVLVPDRDEFDRLVRDLLRVEIEVPSHPARIAQPQRTDMVVLSPSAYEEHSPFTYRQEEFERLLVHEAVHMIEEFLSPNIEASPRWWGEGLAVYFSDQWRYEDDFRKPALDGVAKGEVPSLEQIETEAKHAYDWGWTIVAFIESQYGRETVVRIVRECADGDVCGALDMPRETVQDRWRAWICNAEELRFTGSPGST